jgi:hypothetical protein
MDRKFEERLALLWLEEFVGEDGRCVLCDNSGWVEERPCICPNGRARARHQPDAAR